uniref:tRNA-dihydrouridine(16/17) synthase [NAD(P)(+)] n=1 Tax=Timema douglasi TaxID=61478 RepID=A0A7R8VI00_TIMDO|nr:unnamed protein product [Timema douglasi]
MVCGVTADDKEIGFCGNDAQVMLEAALLAERECDCDAVDINLGCPQAIARRGHYGAFLQDDWPLLAEIGTYRAPLSNDPFGRIVVSVGSSALLEYARMLEAAGCQMLTVHGRTREQKGPLTGLANWEHIKAVSESVGIPVLANGNIQCLTDVARCLQETGCHGVMSAEGNLYNPALFEGRSPPAWELALEYLDLAEKYPCPVSYVRGHLFKLFQHCLSLPENFDLRAELGTGSDLVDFRATVQQLKERYLPFDAGEKPWAPHPGFDLIHPPWLCHSYVRPAPEEHLKKMVEKQNRNADINQFGDELQAGEAEKENQDGGVLKRPRESSMDSAESKNMSKRRMKKLRKLKHKPNTVSHARRGVDKCVDCPNPVVCFRLAHLSAPAYRAKGSKCDYRLCKACCRTKCYVEDMDCIGHRIHTKSRREKAREYADIESRALAEAAAATTEPVPDQTKPSLLVDLQSSADSVVELCLESDMTEQISNKNKKLDKNVIQTNNNNNR